MTRPPGCRWATRRMTFTAITASSLRYAGNNATSWQISSCRKKSIGRCLWAWISKQWRQGRAKSGGRSSSANHVRGTIADAGSGERATLSSPSVEPIGTKVFFVALVVSRTLRNGADRRLVTRQKPEVRAVRWHDGLECSSLPTQQFPIGPIGCRLRFNP